MLWFGFTYCKVFIICAVALDTIVVNWFASKAVALAMGICVSAGRLGTWMTFNVNPFAINFFGTWKAALWVAAAFGVLSFTSACIYILLDKFAESQRRAKTIGSINAEEPAPESINLGVVRTFPATFWIICILVTMYYAVVFPFESTATKLLSQRYGYSEANAGRIISLLPLVSMILSPIFGFFVDKVGYRPFLVLAGEVAMLAAILFMALTTFNPIPSVVIVGVVFSLVPAALWPCIPVVITGQFATAFGLMTSIMNLGLLLTYYMQGLVDDIFHGNTQYALLFYTALGGFGLLMAVVWVLTDIKSGWQCSQKNTPAPEH
jgi:nitrate/nitrite transporter NarK